MIKFNRNNRNNYLKETPFENKFSWKINEITAPGYAMYVYTFY